MKKFLKMKLNKRNIVLIFLVLLIPFCYWQNNGLMVTQYDYISDKITEDLDGYKIVQVSDLHNKRFGANNEKLLEVIKNQKPDIIVVTGDLIDSNHTNIKAAIEFMESVVTVAPVYYITGNHEEWLNTEEKEQLMRQIDQVGVKIIDDKSILLGNGKGFFYLLGLADKSLLSDKLMQMTKELNVEQQLVILLAHEPQYIGYYSSTKVDLVLTGHAHGGQFRIPFIGGLVAPDQGFFPYYTEGVHTEGRTTMVISRGLGNSIIPFRLFNRPEIVCVQLKSQ